MRSIHLAFFIVLSICLSTIYAKTTSTTPSLKPTTPPPIGFARTQVIPDTPKAEDPVGKFVVPSQNAAGVDFPDLSMKNSADNSVIPNMTANINGQIIGGIIKNALMGTNHPTIWDDTHCVQVADIARPPTQKPTPGCVSQSGWYMDVPTGKCQPITVNCNQMATPNFFYTEALCTQWCTDKKGKPIKTVATNRNLNPEVTCIQQPIVKMGTSKKTKNVYTYDAISLTCWKIQIPQDTVTSMNVYSGTTAGASCEHMCHKIASAGSGVGFSLFNAMAGLPSVTQVPTQMDNMSK